MSLRTSSMRLCLLSGRLSRKSLCPRTSCCIAGGGLSHGCFGFFVFGCRPRWLQMCAKHCTSFGASELVGLVSLQESTAANQILFPVMLPTIALSFGVQNVLACMQHEQHPHETHSKSHGPIRKCITLVARICTLGQFMLVGKRDALAREKY